MVAGGAVGQLVTLLLAPVLTRLYTPADFGVLAVFTSIISILGVLTTLRLEVAVVLPESEEEAAAVAWLAGTCAIVVALVIGAAGPLVAAPLGALLDAPALPGLWWLVALTSLLVGAFQLLSAWITREQRYSALGLRNFSLGTATVGGQLGLGLLGAGSIGLLLGQAAGYLAAVCGLGSARRALRRPARGAVLAALRRYRRFPLVASWSAVLNSAGQQAPILVVSAMYGQFVVGLLGLTVRVLAAPVVLVGRAVAQVFLGEASAASRTRTGDMARQLRNTVLALVAIGALPALVLALFAPALFGVLFGAQWVEAGHYAQLLSLGYLAQFAVSPVSQTLLLLERQALQLTWDSSRLVLTCGAPLACAVLGAPADVAVAALSAAFVVSYTALFLTCWRLARRQTVAVATA